MKYINTNKIEKIKLDKDNFYVAIDFDKTITATNSDDSWNASGNTLGKEFNKKSFDLYQKYAPIELNYHISFEEKKQAMEEWYYSCMNLYYEYHLTLTKLKESINKSNLIFRKGAKKFLKVMYENNIPVIILSAGIGNVIVEFLKNNNCYYENINIISNFIEFDETGNMKKYDKEIIHTLNKTMNGNINEDLAKKIISKQYRLLLGDFIEDKNMIPSSDWKNTITIGFLGKNIEENLDIYNKNFDIVLTKENATFDELNELLECK